ncbi:hypothetical protein DNTS_024696 [Danionella cerebrum]|uniref:RNA ligase 1 n=1 Tax=Danionella cerebrum TaxID=2873325 RepID=A0A553R6B6_9TELE|nr:hypothetical protein DNTS_024696 [Danionella translucida]
MRRRGAVQQKIPCVFLTEVRDEPSKKRDCQQFQVVATENVNPSALQADVHCAVATEKIDGTCCYVTTYKGHPQLWARLDRKPTKQADKRFKKYQYLQKTCKGFEWNVDEDFREVPGSWIPAHRVLHENGHPVPDEHGHIPGWVPVDHLNKQYCWHASVVHYEAGVALVLKMHEEDEGVLEISTVPLVDLMEQTLELIGTNINGNPYGLGSKKHPLHVLVPHGILSVCHPPPVDFQQLYSWFQDSLEGKVEGIVWHCDDGTLMKIHRHHLGLKWPVPDPFLNTKPVVIHVDGSDADSCSTEKDLFTSLAKINRETFSCIRDVQLDS